MINRVALKYLFVMQGYQQAETEDAEFLLSSLLALTSFTGKR